MVVHLEKEVFLEGTGRQERVQRRGGPHRKVGRHPKVVSLGTIRRKRGQMAVAKPKKSSLLKTCMR